LLGVLLGHGASLLFASSPDELLLPAQTRRESTRRRSPHHPLVPAEFPRRPLLGSS
jgi:hypothetical protein